MICGVAGLQFENANDKILVHAQRTQESHRPDCDFMSTESEIAVFNTNLRKVLVPLIDEISEIKTKATDATILWGYIAQKDTADEVWRDLIEKARIQGKLVALIQSVASDFPEINEFQHFISEAERLGCTSVLQVKEEDQWAMSYQEVDRTDHLTQFGRAIRETKQRPLVAVWCGDEQAGHEILWSRIKEQSFDAQGRRLAPKYGMCVVSDDNVAEMLTQTCFEKFLDDRYRQDSTGLNRLLTGRDFSDHLIGIRVHLPYERNTVRRLDSVIQWCNDQKSLSEDRRLVVAVSIQVPRPWTSIFWKRSREQAVLDARQSMISQLKDVPSVFVLPHLRDILYQDLLDWKEEMAKRWGPKSEDAFRAKVLGDIVPEGKSRPMDPVSEELRSILKSNHP